MKILLIIAVSILAFSMQSASAMDTLYYQKGNSIIISQKLNEYKVPDNTIFTIDEIKQLASGQMVKRSVESADEVSGFSYGLIVKIYNHSSHYRATDYNKIEKLTPNEAFLREEVDLSSSFFMVYLPGLFLFILGFFLAKEKVLKAAVTFNVAFAPVLAATISRSSVLTLLVSILCLVGLSAIYWKKNKSIDENYSYVGSYLVLIGLSVLFPLISLLTLRENLTGFNSVYLVVYVILCALCLFIPRFLHLMFRKTEVVKN
ncbi:MAG: hypothetical protein NTY12_00755 [Candidatus Falkowbacteria bacterium]|nr:hypothetical protein [Candidatus Falkowbacteria bacterium]